MNFLSKIKKLTEVRSFTENFVTTITDITPPRADHMHIMGFDAEDDVLVDAATVKWSLDPEYRNYGIKDFGVFVPDQEIQFQGRVGDEPFLKTIKINDIQVEYDSSGGSPHLFPIRLDFFDKKWTITFIVA